MFYVVSIGYDLTLFRVLVLAGLNTFILPRNGNIEVAF
jgi:hypothetical protein